MGVFDRFKKAPDRKEPELGQFQDDILYAGVKFYLMSNIPEINPKNSHFSVVEMERILSGDFEMELFRSEEVLSVRIFSRIVEFDSDKLKSLVSLLKNRSKLEHVLEVPRSSYVKFSDLKPGEKYKFRSNLMLGFEKDPENSGAHNVGLNIPVGTEFRVSGKNLYPPKIKFENGLELIVDRNHPLMEKLMDVAPVSGDTYREES